MSTNDLTTRGGIYQIRNLVNGKVYIGSTANFRTRWVDHLKGLRAERHHSRRLQRAWNKYGRDNLVFEVVEVVDDPSRLIAIEQEYLDRLRPFDRDSGYNISPTAGSCLGVKRTDETKAKVAAATKLQMETTDTAFRLSEANRGHRRRRGAKHTEEAKARISDRTKEWANRPGVRERLSEAAKRRCSTPAGREHMARTAAAGRLKAGRSGAMAMAKLDEAKVSEMRRRFSSGEATCSSLAREFGISVCVASRAIRGLAWSHVGVNPFAGHNNGIVPAHILRDSAKK